MKPSSSAPPPLLIGAAADLRAAERVLIPPTERAPERPPSDLIWNLSGQSMGTTWSVHLVPPPGSSQESFALAIEAELAKIIALFSPWVRDSEISRFNRMAAGPLPLSPEFWDLLSRSMDLADDFNGAVDPTLGALVDLWGFGPAGPRNALLPVPSEAEIKTALKASGWQKLRLDQQSLTALQPGGMKLDFSGIAKGHAVDLVSDRLMALGATAHLVEIGGELKGRGVKPDAQPWWAEIETVPGGPATRTIAAMFDIAVATSGDWRRAFKHGDRLYPHTLDGSTGYPVHNGVAQVTVFDASAMRADALATALTVMGSAEGLELATAYGVAAHFVERTAAGLVEHMTPAFAAMMDEEEA